MALSAAVREAFEKTGGGGGRQPALPDGTKVRVQIVPSKKDIGYIEVEPFARDESNPNHRLMARRMRFVAPIDGPHANRNFFANIPVKFEQWSERTSQLVPSYQSIGLIKALGYSLDDIDDDTLEKLTDRELLNKVVEIVVGVEDDQRFDKTDPDEVAKAALNPLYAKRNTIKFINQANGPAPTGAAASSAPRATAAAPTAAPTAAVDPWAAQAAAAPAPAAASDPWAAAATGATV